MEAWRSEGRQNPRRRSSPRSPRSPACGRRPPPLEPELPADGRDRVVGMLRGAHPRSGRWVRGGPVCTPDDQIAIYADQYRQRLLGALREETLGDLLARRPERVIEMAVKGMLPHNRLGSAMYRKLNVYPGADHPHQAQRPHGADEHEQEAA